MYSRFSACRRGRRRLRRDPPREPIRGPSPPGAAGAERGRWLRSPYSTRRRMPWAFSPCLQVFDSSAPIASRGVLNRSGDVNQAQQPAAPRSGSGRRAGGKPSLLLQRRNPHVVRVAVWLMSRYSFASAWYRPLLAVANAASLRAAPVLAIPPPKAPISG